MEIILKQTAPSPNGEEVVCKIEIKDGRNVQRISGEIALDFFDGLGIPTLSETDTVLSREKYEAIEYAMKKTDAVKKGLSLLSFSQNTKRALCQKLMIRGVSREIASDAVDFIASCGYIDEEYMASRYIEELANNRLYGMARIKNELYQKGFDPEVCANAARECDIDFVEICRRRIEKLGGASVFADKNTKTKAASSLVRAGFSYDEIRSALKSKKAD